MSLLSPPTSGCIFLSLDIVYVDAKRDRNLERQINPHYALFTAGLSKIAISKESLGTRETFNFFFWLPSFSTYYRVQHIVHLFLSPFKDHIKRIAEYIDFYDEIHGTVVLKFYRLVLEIRALLRYILSICVLPHLVNPRD